MLPQCSACKHEISSSIDRFWFRLYHTCAACSVKRIGRR
jgi:hypothetical protein